MELIASLFNLSMCISLSFKNTISKNNLKLILILALVKRQCYYLQVQKKKYKI